MGTHNYKKKTLSEIQKAYRQGLIPFIGSGFSLNVSDDFGWPSVLKKLKNYLKEDGYVRKRINLVKLFKRRNPEIIEWLIWKAGGHVKGTREKRFEQGKNWLFHKLSILLNDLELIKYRDNYQWKQHKLLVQLFKRIYTTNWDRCIEHTCYGNDLPFYKIYPVEKKISQASVRFESIIDDDRGNRSKLCKFDERTLCKDSRLVLKVHGDCVESYQAGALTACETDYFKRIAAFATRRSEIDNILLEDLTKHDFLFIGYSFEDPNVQYVLNQLRLFLQASLFATQAKRMYWILPNSPSSIGGLQKFYTDWKSIIPYFLLSEKEKHLKKKIKKRRVKRRIIDLLQKLS